MTDDSTICRNRPQCSKRRAAGENPAERLPSWTRGSGSGEALPSLHPSDSLFFFRPPPELLFFQQGEIKLVGQLACRWVVVVARSACLDGWSVFWSQGRPVRHATPKRAQAETNRTSPPLHSSLCSALLYLTSPISFPLCFALSPSSSPIAYLLSPFYPTR
jgi:hypothetical protein